MNRIPTVLLLFSFFIISFIGCKDKSETDMVVISFQGETINNPEVERVCELADEPIVVGNISDFAIVDDSKFVVCDGKNAFLYATDGKQLKQIGYNGRARGEMISPSGLFVSDNYIYIWCNTLLKFVIFNREAEFIKEITGFESAVRKFIVDEEKIYVYTAGTLASNGKELENVIRVFPVDNVENQKMYASRSDEDEVMFAYLNSGGICISEGKMIYAHPARPILYELDFHTEKENLYYIKDSNFNSTPINHFREITENRAKWIDFLRNNSAIRGLFRDKNNQIVLLAEVGSLETGNRMIKAYILSNAFAPIKSIIFEYFRSPNLVVHENYIYLLETNVVDETTESVELKRVKLD